MLTSTSSRRLVATTWLGLLLALAPYETGLAQQSRSSATTPETPSSSVEPGGAPVRRHLRLALFDMVGLPGNVIDKTRRRVEEILEQVEVAIEWHEPGSASNADDPDEPYYLKIILFDREAAAMGAPADAMGVARPGDSLPDGVWLFDPVILRALRGSSRRARPPSSEELGRAYGLVMAHEIIHAIANSERHADSGVMAPTQNRKLLLSRLTAWDAESQELFVAGLASIQRMLTALRQ